MPYFIRFVQISILLLFFFPVSNLHYSYSCGERVASLFIVIFKTLWLPLTCLPDNINNSCNLEL